MGVNVHVARSLLSRAAQGCSIRSEALMACSGTSSAQPRLTMALGSQMRAKMTLHLQNLWPRWRADAVALALALSAALLPSPAFAYTYTHSIPLGQSVIDGAVGAGYAPGSVIGIEAGSRSSLVIKNLHGTKTAPIVIVNKGGRARIGAVSGGSSLLVQNSSFVQIRGDGDPASFYGFDIWGANNTLSLKDLSTNIELCNLEVHHASGFAGIMFKSDPDCTGYENDFVQRDTFIHDNYIHDVPGEGIYAGYSFWADGKTDCPNGADYPHELVGVRIYNNITERTGREGIQLGSATADVEVFNNFVIDSGVLNQTYQNGAVQLGEGTTGKFYRNFIANVPGNGLILLGRGDRKVYDNIIVNSGEYAIFSDNRGSGARAEIPGSVVSILNNTLVNYGKDAYLVYNEITANEFANNLLTSPNTGFHLVREGSGATCSVTANISAPLSGLGFVDSSHNDSVSQMSPLPSMPALT